MQRNWLLFKNEENNVSTVLSYLEQADSSSENMSTEKKEKLLMKEQTLKKGF